MRTAGIICEYNPFHAGHSYQIQKIREKLGNDAAVICLMSGNYVQRGEPAIYEKHLRAEAAIRGGADLVLELPITVALSAAGSFAAGAVDCFAALNCIDVLCFGSEIANESLLIQAAKLMETDAFQSTLKSTLKQGVSYAAAREQALIELGGAGECLRRPNTALGIDYLRRIVSCHYDLEPLIIQRAMELPTASQLRDQLMNDPQQKGEPIHGIQYGERAMLAVLRTLPDSAYESMPFGSEGLWSKIRRACRGESEIESIIQASKSKRYTWSRLRRGIMCLFLGLSQNDMEKEVPYIRILSFNDKGRAILHSIKKSCQIPLVSGSIPRDKASMEYFALESRATDLYGLFSSAAIPARTGLERAAAPRYIKQD